MKRLLAVCLIAILLINGVVTTNSIPVSATDAQFVIEDGNLIRYTGTDTKITIPDTVTFIQGNVFASNTTLTEIIIPDSVTAIGQGTFKDCTNLRSVKLSSNLSYIDDATFENCTALTTIEIPKSVSLAVSSPFKGCTALKSITFEKGMDRIPEGLLTDSCIEEITLPDSILTVETQAFYHCENLKKVTMPQVTTIQYMAFGSCPQLTDISMPNIATIGSFAFNNCQSLSSIELPNTLETLQGGAFSECDSLTEATVPSSLQKCTSAQKKYDDEFDSYGPFSNCDNFKKITFADGTTTTAPFTLYRCHSLEEVILPEGLEYIDKSRFRNVLI